jgi:hypothetical protein
MKRYIIIYAKIAKNLYSKFFSKRTIKKTRVGVIENPNLVSETLFLLLSSNKPSMTARFGSTELTCIYNYLGVSSKKKNYVKYIQSKSPPFWWEKNIMKQMLNWSGFFPPTKDKLAQFCELMLNDMLELDILVSWLDLEADVKKFMNSQIIRIDGLCFDPYWANNPWTRVLKGKKVLVIHPFEDSIKKQYAKRELLFANKDVLPEFELYTIKAVQSLGGNINYKDWFEALDSMKNQIDTLDFDICLIGAGAYGFALAAHVKRKGKKAVHMGGALQLLFGIKGKRWENWDVTYRDGIEIDYKKLPNEHWIRPLETEKSSNFKNVEGGCYW